MNITIRPVMAALIIMILSGCKEEFGASSEFNASSEYDARVSYNRIFRGLSEEDRDNFARQYALYITPYRLEPCELGRDLCTVTRLQKLNRMSYEAVINTVSDFESEQKIIAREAEDREAAKQKKTELEELRTLHTKWTQVQNAPKESMKTFKVEIAPVREFGRNLASWEAKNVTTHTVSSFHISFDIIDKELGKEHRHIYSSNYTKPVPPGGTASGVIVRDDIQDFLNNRYSLIGYMTNVKLEGAGIIFESPSMDKYKYDQLKNKYPEEFKEISNNNSAPLDFKEAKDIGHSDHPANPNNHRVDGSSDDSLLLSLRAIVGADSTGKVASSIFALTCLTSAQTEAASNGLNAFVADALDEGCEYGQDAIADQGAKALFNDISKQDLVAFHDQLAGKSGAEIMAMEQRFNTQFQAILSKARQ